MKDLIQEFRDFALKGNIVELAIAFVLGGAFASVVNSLVDNMILPIVAGNFRPAQFQQPADKHRRVSYRVRAVSR